MVVGIAPNLGKDIGLNITRRLVEFIAGRGARAVAEGRVCDALEGCAISPSLEPAAECDFLVVIGGDGTILNAAAKAAKHGTPLLGVNAGKLGFLASVERENACAAVGLVLDGKGARERRMMIEARFEDCPPALALNDLCASRAGAGLSRFVITVNGQYVDTYAADGVIVCTPTGSTAYNLSAGGPLLAPTAEMLAVTPVCPHTLYARPWVLSGGDVIEVSAEGAAFHADGRAVPTKAGRCVIKKAALEATLLRVNQPSFYDVLREKMITGK